MDCEGQHHCLQSLLPFLHVSFHSSLRNKISSRLRTEVLFSLMVLPLIGGSFKTCWLWIPIRYTHYRKGLKNNWVHVLAARYNFQSFLLKHVCSCFVAWSGLQSGLDDALPALATWGLYRSKNAPPAALVLLFLQTKKLMFLLWFSEIIFNLP